MARAKVTEGAGEGGTGDAPSAPTPHETGAVLVALAVPLEGRPLELFRRSSAAFLLGCLARTRRLFGSRSPCLKIRLCPSRLGELSPPGCVKDQVLFGVC